MERMTKQGEVDTLQMSRPRAQEVIHITQRLPAPHVHARRSPTLDLMKDKQPGHKALVSTMRLDMISAALKRFLQRCRLLNKDFVTLINFSC